MSRDALVTLDWADGTYPFKLGWGDLARLQEDCDAGPFVVLARIQSMTCRVQEISSVIRNGLIGGGMSPTDATKKVRLFVEERPPAENLLTAQLVLAAGCHGAPEEQIEKKSEAPGLASGSTASQTGSSDSEQSTGPASA